LTFSEFGSGVYQTPRQTSPSDKFVTTTRPSYKPLADTSSKVTGTIERRHDDHEHVESRKTKNIVKPATYDGKGPWLDFFLLAEFYTTQSGSRVKTVPLKT
jgi:hypothetical protein